MKALLRRIRQILRDRRVRKFFTRFVATVASIVVFVTTYALILPAITLEATAICGLEAHQHDDSCYEDVLVCGLEESDGHKHTDDCYSIELVLTCEETEHTHSVENGCYDEDGNLTCETPEHVHDADNGCYKEVRTLTCEIQESEGHHHGPECYEKVLTCGKEAHTHSTACYSNPSTGSTGEESESAAVASTESAAVGASVAPAVDDHSVDNGSTGLTNGTDSVNAGSGASTGSTTVEYDFNEESATAATTNVMPEEIATEDLSTGYVPELAPVDMAVVLDKHTGFYYFDSSAYAEEHTNEDGTVDMPASSSDITDWQEYDESVELEASDLLRLYLSYTVPAGTLNETNQVSRYRLPSNIRLTDDQILAINQTVNGVAGSYMNMDSLEITDVDKYEFYRGAEAIEGTRTPDVAVNDYLYDLVKDGKEGQEYISAIVKAENVVNEHTGEVEAQDLIFIWTPYSIEKNQNEYDKDGQPTKAGEKITGWFSVDFNTAQVEWVEGDVTTDELTNEDGETVGTETKAEKTADVVFVEKDKESGTKEISQKLMLVEKTVEEQQSEETVDDTENAEQSSTGETAEAAEEAETADAAGTGETAEDAAEEADAAATAATEAPAEEEQAQPVEYQAGTLTASGESYKITLDYTAEAEIPDNAELKVSEITAESDPEAYEACLEQAATQVASDDNTTVDKAATRFFDIEIVAPASSATVDNESTVDDQNATVDNDSSTGGETEITENEWLKIEPKAPVSVNIQLIETAKTVADMAEEGTQQGVTSSDPTVLHYAEEGVETLESTTGAAPAVDDHTVDNGAQDGAGTQQGEATAIQFETSSFSIYGVVFTSTITTTYITASGETYEITVTYDESAGIPEGSELVVTELLPGSEEYVNYLQQSASKLGLVSSDVQFARFFDIEIQKVDPTTGDVEKIEPKTPVSVQIKYVDPVDISEDASLNVIHFAEKETGVVTEVIAGVEVSEDNREISYTQDSFSVTGTIGGTPNAGDQQMILVKDGNRYYIVNNDATLTEVGYDSTRNTVSVIEPMLWTFEGSGNNRHIYFNSEATGFGTNQVASDYYRRYLDPTASTETHNGYTEENKDVAVSLGDYNPAQWWNQDTGTYVSNNFVSNRNNALNETVLSYDEGSHAIHQGNTYFAIERDEDGRPVRLIGQTDSEGAAYFEFATASEVPSGMHLDNAVNHIDISIQGSAKVDIPLAYGSYYGPNGAAGSAIKVVTENEKLELGEAQMVDPSQLGITADDMKRATISASSPNSADLNEAFYITGFSQNTGTAYSTPQVRIEGKFLVADVPADQNYNGHSLRNVEGNLYDGYGWWGTGRDWNYVNAVRAARLANKVTYTVTVIKPLQYYLTDPELGQLYDSEGNPIIVTVDVAFSASFNYWDDENSANGGNECPPIQNNSDWRAGDIPNHDLSGMDFKLGGDADDPNSPLVALEITKIIQDENGNRIALKTPVTNTFDIYQNTTARRNGVQGINVGAYTTPVDSAIYNGYSPLHSKKITVGTEGMALVYDYNVSDGMYYIVEKSDAENLPRTVTDTSDNEWDYVETYIETEYVRRGDQYDDKTQYPDPMHYSPTYTNPASEYKSVPEVLGKFTTLKGEEKKSGFLEFYVYNIYKPKKTELTFNKIWPDAVAGEQEGTKNITIGETTYNLSDLRIEVELQRYTNNSTTPDNLSTTTDNPLPVNVWKLTLDGVAADNVSVGTDPIGFETANWSCVWKNLPSGSGGKTYTYSVKEVSVKAVVGESLVDLTDEFIRITDKTGSNGVTVTNTLNTTDVTLEKQWDPVPTGDWSATFQIQRARRQITDAQGNTVADQPWSDWEQARTEAGERGTAVPNQIINQGTPGAKVTIDDLPKCYKDNSGVIWEYEYRGLETAFSANEEGYERNVTQEGDAAHGYAIVVTNKLSGTTSVTANKQWRSSVENNAAGNSGVGGNNGGNDASGNSGINNDASNIADPNVTAVEFTLYELIIDDNRPEGSVKIGTNWYKPATDADGHTVNPQRVSRAGNNAWNGTEHATWNNLSREKTYYVVETGTYYKNGSGEIKLASAPNYDEGGAVTLINGQRTTTIFNTPLTLRISKTWDGLVTGEDWPQGYEVEYTITREYSYKEGSTTVKEPDTPFKFEVKKSNTNAQYVLSSNQKYIDLAGDDFPAYGVKDGRVVSYTYFVEETKVVKADGTDSGYTFKTGERKVFLQDGSTVGLLKADINNQLTSVSVQKRWNGNHASDTATVTLYRYVDTGQSVNKVITVHLAENDENVATRTNLGGRTVYVVMDGDESTKQELKANANEDTVTFTVPDDAEHYFTYSLSDTNNGLLTVTGQGHAHAGETVNVAVQRNDGARREIIVKVFDPESNVLNGHSTVTVNINGQQETFTYKEEEKTFYVLGNGTFPVSYSASASDVGITAHGNDNAAPRQVVVNSNQTRIEIDAKRVQPFIVELQKGNATWSQGDYLRVLIDGGDRGVLTFTPDEYGNVPTQQEIILGDNGQYPLTFLTGGNVVFTSSNGTMGQSNHRVIVQCGYDSTLSLEKGTFTFNIVPDGNFQVRAGSFKPSDVGSEIQNSYTYNNITLNSNNTSWSQGNLPIAWTYTADVQTDNNNGNPPVVTATGCTATLSGTTLTISNITSTNPTITFSKTGTGGKNNTDPKRSTSFFAQLLGAPITVYAAETRTSFSDGNGLTVTGIESLPAGVEPEVVGTYTGTGTEWSHTWKDLPVVDENGRTIHYYVVETGANTTGHYESVEANHTVEINPDGSYSVVIVNTTTGEEPQTGAIKITKKVTVNDADPTDSNKAKTSGTYEFTVAGVTGTDTAGVTHTVKITFADGKATKYQIDSNAEQSVTDANNSWSVVLDGLTAGNYTVTETTPTNGMVLETVTGTNVNSSTKVATVTVTAGDTTPTSTAAVVEFKNNYTEYEVIIVKEDTTTPTTKLNGAVFDLYEASQVNDDGTKKQGATAILTGLTTAGEGADMGKVSLGNLTLGTYYLFETHAPDGYDQLTAPIRVVVTDGSVSLFQGATQRNGVISQNKAEIEVFNNPGVQLPSTGGPGTRLIYILGGMMTLAAGLLLLHSRKRIGT